MPGQRWGFLLGMALVLACIPALADVAVPQVTGPVAAPDVPGAPSHNYIFFASNHDLAAHGYVEEEFFIRGTASTYNLPDDNTGSVKDSGLPYYTRVVVRRPADPRRFNGTAVVEWYNVTNQFDAENFWFFDWEHMMRAGYVWVGVSPQTVGVAALKKWSPACYGALDVGKVVAGSGPPGGPDADAMSYDIFSQVAAALRHPGGTDMLHGLKAKVILAAGESQSAGRLCQFGSALEPCL
jgi:Alpha/beta hydrolase domain